MDYEILITPSALEMIQGIKDKRVRAKLIERIDELQHEPEKQGKPMVADLAGYRSVRTVGQRYRIIYRIEEEQVVVIVVAAGIRKEGDKRDIYKLAQRLIKLGLVEPQSDAKDDED